MQRLSWPGVEAGWGGEQLFPPPPSGATKVMPGGGTSGPLGRGARLHHASGPCGLMGLAGCAGRVNNHKPPSVEGEPPCRRPQRRQADHQPVVLMKSPPFVRRPRHKECAPFSKLAERGGGGPQPTSGAWTAALGCLHGRGPRAPPVLKCTKRRRAACRRAEPGL